MNIRKTLLIFLLPIILLFSANSKVYAHPNHVHEIRTNIETIQKADRSENKYVGNENVYVGDNVAGDLIGVANDFTTDHTIINDNLIAAGGNILIQSEVYNSAYLAGGKIEMYGSVNNNLMVAGGAIMIDSDVVHDSFVTGGYVIYNGNVGGDLRISAGEVYINSDLIEGDLFVGAAELHIASWTKIEGKIINESEQTFENQENNPIKLPAEFDSFYGLGARDITINIERKDDDFAFAAALTTLMFSIFFFIANFLAAYVVLRLFPTFAEKTFITMQKKFGKSMTYGVLTYIIAPFVGILLLFTLIGYKLFLILTLLGVLAMYLSKIYSMYMIGRHLLKAVNFKKTGRFLVLLVGMGIVESIMFVLNFIPILGWFLNAIIMFVLGTWGLGAIILNKMEPQK